MELSETKKILAYIAAAYPRYFSNVTKESANRQAVVWTDVLGEYSASAVMTGVKCYIAADHSGFPPSPGQIIEQIHFTAQPNNTSGTQAWALVRRAVNVPWDQFDAAFNTLPKVAQIAVGSPESLKELAQMDTQRFETVAQSNFLRMYDAAQRREAKTQATPNDVLAVADKIRAELETRRPSAKAIEQQASAPAPALHQHGGNAGVAADNDSIAVKLAALRRRMGVTHV